MLGVIFSLALAGAPAPAGEAAVEAPVDDLQARLKKAEELHERGKASFDTADYEGAIELWTEAYAAVPDVPEGAAIKAHILYNVGAAREREFEANGDVAQLRRARIVFVQFETIIEDLYPDPAAAAEERKRVEAKIAELDQKIAAAEGKGESEPAVVTPVVPPPTKDDRNDKKPPPPGRGLVIAGGVLVGVGAVGLGVMTGGLVLGENADDISGIDPDDKVAREAQFDDGRAANVMAIVGGSLGGVAIVAGGVCLITGAVAWGVTARKKKKEGGVAFGPGPGQLGLGLTGRF
jgi:hypothetical protein